MPWRSATRRRRGRSLEQVSALRRGNGNPSPHSSVCLSARRTRAGLSPAPRSCLDRACATALRSSVSGLADRGRTTSRKAPRDVAAHGRSRRSESHSTGYHGDSNSPSTVVPIDAPPSVSPSRRLPDPTCPSWASRLPTFMSRTLLNSRACENLTGCDTFRYHEPAGWSSLVARWAHNPKVAGSNPAPATNP